MSWESISLSDALRPLKSSPFTRDELNYSGGQYQNVHYGDILVRFPSVVDAEKEGLPYVSDSAEGRCSRCSLLQNGDIIIADTAEDEAVGKAIEIQGITDQKVVSGLHTMAFRPQEGLFAPGFLGYFLNSSVYHNQLLPLMQGIKVLSISKTAIGDTVIKYPSYKEQEKIVESLSGVDDMIGALDEAIAKKQQIKESLMQQLLTGKTRLPGFNGDWLTISLGSISQMYQPQTITQDSLTISGYPVYGANGVIGRYPYHNHTTDQVMITCRGSSCGTVNYSRGKCWITGNAMVVNMDGYNVNKRFVYYVLDRSDLSSLITGSGQPQIVRTPLQRFEICIPKSIEEQTAIAECLDSFEIDISSVESKRDKYALTKQGMMQELLTGKTRLI